MREITESLSTRDTATPCSPEDAGLVRQGFHGYPSLQCAVRARPSPPPLQASQLLFQRTASGWMRVCLGHRDVADPSRHSTIAGCFRTNSGLGRTSCFANGTSTSFGARSPGCASTLGDFASGREEFRTRSPFASTNLDFLRSLLAVLGWRGCCIARDATCDQQVGMGLRAAPQGVRLSLAKLCASRRSSFQSISWKTPATRRGSPARSLPGIARG